MKQNQLYFLIGAISVIACILSKEIFSKIILLFLSAMYFIAGMFVAKMEMKLELLEMKKGNMQFTYLAQELEKIERNTRKKPTRRKSTRKRKR